MVRQSANRINKYNAKLNSNVIGQRYDATKKLAVDQQKEYFASAERLEKQVKLIVDGEPVFLHHFYIAFAEEMAKKTTIGEQTIAFNKWAQRGLNFIKMREIGKALFGERLDLKVVAPIPNLIGHWTFYEGVGLVAHDLSGNNNHGTSPTFPTWTAGVIGRGLLFDGIDDLINTTVKVIPDGTTSFTVICWVRWDGGASAFQNIISKITGSGLASRQPCIQKSNLNYWRFRLRNTVPTELDLSSDSTAVQGKWYHLAGTWNATTGEAYFYVNGIRQTQTGILAAPMQSETGKTTLGSEGTINWLNGVIDEVMFFNKVLTAEERKKIYDLTKPF